ncbi:fatty acid desaturase [Thiotrichales bacterium 19S3-7]|nr:fatty acid desaturase [Thiotrichales bacterium 19S3-7]MCF6802669.1 fatty acid desaturase [Thiotrichales bacterium 19S3-11]
MFSFFNKKPLEHQVVINGKFVDINHRETILQGALKAGIDFPNSCRVGGCATCKCRLTKGKVRELTETGYILSNEELSKGYILACQSRAITDIEVEVDLDASEAAQSVKGTVSYQEKLTHDITELRIKLDEKLDYKAGQYISLTFDDMPNVSRNYSFATPVNADQEVCFYIRHINGGVLSTLIAKNNLLGKCVTLEGPKGDFYLRSKKNNLFFIAGGSGLAPILAILQQALDEDNFRPVTLLFGARTTNDLYQLEKIRQIQKNWPERFEFHIVLSDAYNDENWQGKKGLVADHIKLSDPKNTEVYLCGPKAMIDHAQETLISIDVEKQSIYADRFLTTADIKSLRSEPTEDENSNIKQSMMIFHYLKYTLFHFVGLFAAAAIFAGGSYTIAAFIMVVLFYTIGDELSGNDTSTPNFKNPKLLTYQLWLALPLLILIVFALIWRFSNDEFLNIGTFLSNLSGINLLQIRADNSIVSNLSAILLTGLMIGLIGTITAHELTHRTWDKASMLIGRWLLAFSFDTAFSIEHVYGHHRYVATSEDPATAPRGRNVYFHIFASTIKGNISAWRIEKNRLNKKSQSFLSFTNVLIRGYLMSIFLVILAYLIGGLSSMFAFIACGLIAKALLEIVNYMEHYGIVRNPALPVQPRHSWNTNKRLSSWSMFNLTRHSHHHAAGEVAYQDLKPYPDAPMMISGYLTTIVIALIPPLWFKLMHSKLNHWDEEFASKEEKLLIKKLL